MIHEKWDWFQRNILQLYLPSGYSDHCQHLFIRYEEKCHCKKVINELTALGGVCKIVVLGDNEKEKNMIS